MTPTAGHTNVGMVGMLIVRMRAFAKQRCLAILNVHHGKEYFAQLAFGEKMSGKVCLVVGRAGIEVGLHLPGVEEKKAGWTGRIL